MPTILMGDFNEWRHRAVFALHSGTDVRRRRLAAQLSLAPADLRAGSHSRLAERTSSATWPCTLHRSPGLRRIICRSPHNAKIVVRRHFGLGDSRLAPWPRGSAASSCLRGIRSSKNRRWRTVAKRRNFGESNVTKLSKRRHARPSELQSRLAVPRRRAETGRPRLHRRRLCPRRQRRDVLARLADRRPRHRRDRQRRRRRHRPRRRRRAPDFRAGRLARRRRGVEEESAAALRRTDPRATPTRSRCWRRSTSASRSPTRSPSTCRSAPIASSITRSSPTSSTTRSRRPPAPTNSRWCARSRSASSAPSCPGTIRSSSPPGRSARRCSPAIPSC